MFGSAVMTFLSSVYVLVAISSRLVIILYHTVEKYSQRQSSLAGRHPVTESLQFHPLSHCSIDPDHGRYRQSATRDEAMQSRTLKSDMCAFDADWDVNNGS